jgi:hypothetical protein
MDGALSRGCPPRAQCLTATAFHQQLHLAVETKHSKHDEIDQDIRGTGKQLLLHHYLKVCPLIPFSDSIPE